MKQINLLFAKAFLMQWEIGGMLISLFRPMAQDEVLFCIGSNFQRHIQPDQIEELAEP